MMNEDLKNHTNPRRKHKTWTKVDNELASHCYFRSIPTQRGYRKKLKRSGKNVQVFRLADQVGTIIKDGFQTLKY